MKECAPVDMYGSVPVREYVQLTPASVEYAIFVKVELETTMPFEPIFIAVVGIVALSHPASVSLVLLDQLNPSYDVYVVASVVVVAMYASGVVV
jgi:hypothetical protein